MAAAILLASTPAVENRAREAAEEFADLATVLDKAAREAYHDLVRTDGFPDWFAQVTPLEEIGALRLGSRPARRGVSTSSLEDLRAIPWVFSWAQTRVNLPGWYGLGTGLAAVADLPLLRQAQSWPLFTVLLENAEMSLAKTDRRIAYRYLELGGRPDLTEKVLDEHARTTSQVLAVTGHTRLLEDRRVLGRAVALRNLYVDALSICRFVRFAPCVTCGTMRACADYCRSRSTELPPACRTPAEAALPWSTGRCDGSPRSPRKLNRAWRRHGRAMGEPRPAPGWRSHSCSVQWRSQHTGGRGCRSWPDSSSLRPCRNIRESTRY